MAPPPPRASPTVSTVGHRGGEEHRGRPRTPPHDDEAAASPTTSGRQRREQLDEETDDLLDEIDDVLRSLLRTWSGATCTRAVGEGRSRGGAGIFPAPPLFSRRHTWSRGMRRSQFLENTRCSPM
ncbi:ubiquitin-like protein Pup [Saccharopolyspora rhizosphaerae]